MEFAVEAIKGKKIDKRRSNFNIILEKAYYYVKW